MPVRKESADCSGRMLQRQLVHIGWSLQACARWAPVLHFSSTEGTLRYWRNVGLGPIWHKLEGSIRYELADVEAYVQSSRRIPSVRAFMEQRHRSEEHTSELQSLRHLVCRLLL